MIFMDKYLEMITFTVTTDGIAFLYRMQDENLRHFRYSCSSFDSSFLQAMGRLGQQQKLVRSASAIAERHRSEDLKAIFRDKYY